MSVRFERSIHVPEDELCFFVFEARSGSEAALAAQQAALEPLRIVEAISSDAVAEPASVSINQGGGRQ